MGLAFHTMGDDTVFFEVPFQRNEKTQFMGTNLKFLAISLLRVLEGIFLSFSSNNCTEGWAGWGRVVKCLKTFFYDRERWKSPLKSTQLDSIGPQSSLIVHSSG